MYEFALFLHMLAVIALFSAITIEHTGGGRIRRATTVEELRRWVGFVRVVDFIFPVAVLVLIVTGVYMALDQFSLEVAWVGVSFALLVVVAVAGPTVQGRKLKALDKALEAMPDGALSAELRSQAVSPVVWGSVFASSGIAVGIVANMTMKPDMVGALLWPLVIGLLGLIGGVMSGRGATRKSPSQAG